MLAEAVPAMPRKKSEIAVAIERARLDFDQALVRLQALAEDDRHRVCYSVHALNNYLMVVGTTLQLLKIRLGPDGDRDVRRWLDSLKQATNLMMSTNRGVLTATPEGVPPLLLESSSLAEIAEHACIAYADIARAKKVKIRWRRPAVVDSVVTDRVAAGAVLDNLLSNALKYSDEGGIVFVTISVGGDEVVCAVRDRGPGLSEEDQSHLFERGVRLSARPTQGEPSSGYGLAIAHDLSRALGGRLWCTSTLGQGSCFLFGLPLSKQNALAAAS